MTIELEVTGYLQESPTDCVAIAYDAALALQHSPKVAITRRHRVDVVVDSLRIALVKAISTLELQLASQTRVCELSGKRMWRNVEESQ